MWYRKRVITAITTSVILLFFSVFCILYWVNEKEFNFAKNMCMEYNIMADDKDDTYISSLNFFISILKVAGVTEEIADYYIDAVDIGSMPVNDAEGFYSDNDWLPIGYIHAAYNLNIIIPEYLYGDTKISATDAVYMIESLLHDLPKYEEKIERQEVYKLAKSDGILTFKDNFYVRSRELKRKHAYILIARLIDSKRYKYMGENKICIPNPHLSEMDFKVYPDLKIDGERSITYREFLDNEDGPVKNKNYGEVYYWTQKEE